MSVLIYVLHRQALSGVYHQVQENGTGCKCRLGQVLYGPKARGHSDSGGVCTERKHELTTSYRVLRGITDTYRMMTPYQKIASPSQKPLRSRQLFR